MQFTLFTYPGGMEGLTYKTSNSQTWTNVLCVVVCGDRTLSVFLQDPRKQQSINSVMVSSGWAEATGVGSVTVSDHFVNTH